METKQKYLMYLRKSTEAEDRQTQSIESQKKELEKLARHLDVKIVGVFQESKSAKKPGREQFNKMLSAIKQGKADGIICWKLNRLARNPVDGGEIMWLLQQGLIQSIQTVGREYKTVDNVIMMSVEFGMANQYVIDLGKDVRRGLLNKAEQGWRPGRAPIGYKNDKGTDQGKKQIFVDEVKFPIVRKMWDLMLTGDYSVSKIIEIANNEWGLRRMCKGQEIKLHASHGYDIFTNPFYCGKYEWTGKVYEGNHTPMITEAEFDYVQGLLGNKTKPQTKHKILPYRGTIRCGECGCHITTQLKLKHIKTENVVRTFIYHNCTRKKLNVNCKQKSITYNDINKQIADKLDKITIPKSFLDYALKILRRDNELEVDNRNIMIENQQKALKKCQDRIDKLLDIYISPENANKDLIGDDEFKERKATLLKEKDKIQQSLDDINQRADEWLELTEKTFKFAVYAKHNFNVGDYTEKTNILRALGSDFTLKDGVLDITLRKQYQLIEKGLETIKAECPRLELTNFALDKTKTAQSKAVFELLSG
ncbi:MAG TPA: recombinase family protein [Candidatus Moranbacteria bacterium]|nr:recombinase family protein [Candidatus Moranbacteria bacterium]HRZ33567.1 recombinase family protein [Candidatus Moranbacteria bacterium]